ncbi:acanthoscurrin-2-like [Macrobrachium nipponense]|uniref:acanthoscurrin-2-like n=1 Tax=Macrobrachium nipponense TaxID=159736 RepID=UPI0030C81F66
MGFPEAGLPITRMTQDQTQRLTWIFRPDAPLSSCLLSPFIKDLDQDKNGSAFSLPAPATPMGNVVTQCQNKLQTQRYQPGGGGGGGGGAAEESLGRGEAAEDGSLGGGGVDEGSLGGGAAERSLGKGGSAEGSLGGADERSLGGGRVAVNGSSGGGE